MLDLMDELQISRHPRGRVKSEYDPRGGFAPDRGDLSRPITRADLFAYCHRARVQRAGIAVNLATVWAIPELLFAGPGYCTGNGNCHQAGSSSTRISVTHLTHQYPRRSGATRRTGK